ncbi:hypothetical protein BCR32DRAFT_306332 [Anaeromyces robustus]|uniref:Uncharacterized protein n=1 Tax=Anaeromyces robustus TaxID=1754192 RepID=A0A1Y1VUS7_9FUNG|nr:hypothetical protein BCR32DRAFT_306332 [Anaeromyces robustus]|eukprot:ORX65040.1 hypothetical protein BCR32DRAFT_306332 [Anaeromyces robustus]
MLVYRYCVLLLLIFTTTLVSADNAIGELKGVWNGICSILNTTVANKFFSCSAKNFSVTSPYTPLIRSKNIYQIPRNTCRVIQLKHLVVSEVCSQQPFKLYSDWRKSNVKGCYSFGTPHKDFIQCCQVTLPENGNLLPQNATFCSGPYEGYKSHGNTNVLCPKCAQQVLEIPKYCKDASDKSDECNKQRLNIERDCVLAIDC